MFIDYPLGVKGYKLWNLDEEMPRTMINIDVTFDENSFIDQDKENKDRKGKEKAVNFEQQEEDDIVVYDTPLEPIQD